MSETRAECSENLQKFFEAINDYDLWSEEKLIKSAVKTCVEMDETIADDNYKLFIDLVIEYDLCGTSDLVDPITNLALVRGLTY